MPVSALVLTLSTDAQRRAQTLSLLRASHELRVGTPDGPYVPVVIDTDQARSSSELCERLGEIPGVELVSVVGIDFSEGF